MPIDRIENYSEDGTYLEYMVFYDDGSWGSADLNIVEVSESYMAEPMRKEGLADGDLIGQINFFPNSETQEPRKGNGSIVLEHLLADAKKRNVRAIFGYATNTTSDNFFKKKGFNFDADPFFYLMT